jgi:outer membrane immunogenic protein
MKKATLLAGVATGALAIAAPAGAADLRMPVKAAPAPAYAPAPTFSWTGCYIGAHVGWGWGKKDFGVFDTSFDPAPSLSGSVDTSGAIFGGQLGCDYQFGAGKGLGGPGAWVIGIQGSISGADINGAGNNASADNGLRSKTDFLASITGRLGWAGWDPRVLLYVRGGVAWAHEKDQVGSSGGFADQSRTGWTVGAGVEWAFAPNWSAFVEWDHYGFGSKSQTFITPESGTPTVLHADIKQDIETVRIGVNYRFNWLFGKAPIAARY